jgi:hypothetical protein
MGPTDDEGIMCFQESEDPKINSNASKNKPARACTGSRFLHTTTAVIAGTRPVPLARPLKSIIVSPIVTVNVKADNCSGIARVVHGGKVKHISLSKPCGCLVLKPAATNTFETVQPVGQLGGRAWARVASWSTPHRQSSCLTLHTRLFF